MNCYSHVVLIGNSVKPSSNLWFVDKVGKSLVVKEHLSSVAFNNITRLAFGKRFMNSEGVIDEQGREFKTIVANGLKIGASLSLAEFVWWLRWMFPLDEELYESHNARRDKLTKKIMEEHTQARKTSGAKQHFVDALLTLKDQYDLSDDTVIGLLWVSHTYSYFALLFHFLAVFIRLSCC